MSMMIGAAAWGFRELPLEQQLKICRDLGCESLELGIANAPGDVPLDSSEEEINIIKTLYEKYDMKLFCGATGNDFSSGDEEEIREQIDKVKRAVDLCRKLGIAYLRIFAGFSPAAEVSGERWERMILAINETASYAKEQGVTLAIETHGGVNGFADGVEHFASVSTETDTLEKLLKELDETVLFVFDPANLAAAGHKNVMPQYLLLKERIAYMHAKNFMELQSGHLNPAAVETGIFDWQKFFAEIMPASGTYLVEYEKPESIVQGIKESLDSLRKWGFV